MFNKFGRWLDSNRGPLVSEATALPTEPQPLPTSANLLLATFVQVVSLPPLIPLLVQYYCLPDVMLLLVEPCFSQKIDSVRADCLPKICHPS